MTKEELIKKYTEGCNDDPFEYLQLLGDATKEQILKYIDGCPRFENRHELETLALYRIEWDLKGSGLLDSIENLIKAVYPTEKELKQILGV